jgi:integrase
MKELVLPLQTIRQTGIRIGELRALSLEQVEVGERVTSIRIDRAFKHNDTTIGKPKNKTTRFVAVDVAAGRELVAHAVRHGRRGGALLFGNARRALNEASVRLAWYQAQFAIRGWLFCRSSNARDTGRAYRLIRLPKPIGEFTAAEFSSFKFGQAGLQKGEARGDGEVFASIADAAAHAGLTLFGLHDLRHLYASVLFAAGISLRKVAQRIGDTEATTRIYYVHWLATDEDDDLEAIAAIG